MKKILVPTDFSNEAENAILVAIYLAQKTGAEIILFNVIEMALPVEYYTIPQVDVATLPVHLDKSEQMKALSEMKQKLLTIEKQIKAKGVKCKSEVDLDVDNVFKDISEVIAKRADVNLIVMGTKGTSCLTEFLLGSHTERVVRYAKSPVLTVKLINDNFKIDKVVYSTDFKETSMEVFSELFKIINIFEAQLCLLYVNTPNYFISNTDINIRFDEFIKKHKLSNFSTHIYSDLSEEKGILNFSIEMNADLIVMPTNGRTDFSQLINGSITEDVVNHATIPVLSINMGKCK